MGYKRPQTVYRLKFEEHEGLEVRAVGVPLGQMLDIAEQADAVKAGTVTDFGQVRELLDLFAKSLRSWNLEEEDGAAVPCTRDALLEQEFPFVLDILGAWSEAIASVPAPLERRSTDGPRSEELNFQTVPLSPSLPN
jgi:hypothetical protein